MDILIDTHIFLWLAGAPEKINKKHMQLLENLNNNIYLSVISIVEIMIKKSIENLHYDADILELLDQMGIEVLNFDIKSALLLEKLPLHHKDPFDRMIIAQAISNNYKIITADNKFKFYECQLL